MHITVQELANLVGGSVEGGSGEVILTGVASVSEAAEGDLTFFANPKYIAGLRASAASAALVPADFNEELRAIRIKVENPSVAFAQIVRRFSPEPVRFSPGIHPTAVIGEGVQLGQGVSVQPHAVIEPGAIIGDRTVIGANCYVGHRAQIGQDCLLYPQVTVREGCKLGNRITVHSGAVIGSDGYGYEQVDGRHVKIPQVGIVQVDDDVEIGANVTIDRARFGRTWIQEGTKIDNLVHIAHNVIIGKHCLLIAQTGISGSTRFGNYVIAAGQTGFAGHITIGDGAVIGAQSGIGKNVAPKATMFGSPAIPMSDFKRNRFYQHRLAELFDRVKKLEQLSGARGKSTPPGE